MKTAKETTVLVLNECDIYDGEDINYTERKDNVHMHLTNLVQFNFNEVIKELGEKYPRSKGTFSQYEKGLNMAIQILKNHKIK